MSILIKGMEMPNDCCQCKLARYDDYENETFCPFTDVMCLSIGRQDNCPLEELPSAQPEPHWIPVTERLPEPQTEVVVSFDNGEVKILWQNWADPSSLSNYPGEPLAYIGGDGIPHTYEEWESMKTYAVAWMPVPEPYKGET